MPLFPSIPWFFRQWYSAFGRVEARCRTKEFDQGLQARTADPLWMLGRQWQVGEFQGEDAGSPIEVSLKHSTQLIKQVVLGDEDDAVMLGDKPLEILVERETLELSWRDRAQIGQEFERMVKQEFTPDGADTVTRIIKWYRGEKRALARPPDEVWVDTDHATRRFIEFMKGRVVDGKVLLTTKITPPESAKFPVDLIARLTKVLDELEDWCTRANMFIHSSRSKAWRGEQLDYRFDLNPSGDTGDGQTHLQAPDYRNGDLDWYNFSRVTPLRGQWEEHGTQKITPTRISVAGTSPRWWAFEDAVTDFGKLDVAKPDLTKLALMEFALIYGDDWFSVPLPVRMSNLVRIDEFIVRDVFGEDTSVEMVQSAKRADPTTNPLTSWEMFTLATKGVPEKVTDSNALFIPTLTGFHEESPPLEEVRFLRDEGANMVWGVEYTLRNGLGHPVNGFDAQRERNECRIEAEIKMLRQRIDEIVNELADPAITSERQAELEVEKTQALQRINRLQEGPRPASSGVPLYRLASTVAENWIPFLPANASAYRIESFITNEASPYHRESFPNIRLLRAQMIRNIQNQKAERVTARSRLLELTDDPLLWLEEANVPRTGRRAQLTAQRIRWVDGKTYVWYGRKVTTGRGEGSSGLRFDCIVSLE